MADAQQVADIPVDPEASAAAASPPLARYAVKRCLFKPADKPDTPDMNLLQVLTLNVGNMEECGDASARGGCGDGPKSVLRDFAHTNHLYQPSLSLVLQRVLVVGVRSFFLLLSDAFTSVWALAVDDEQMMQLVYLHRDGLRGSRLQVVLQKCMMRKSACYFLATNIRLEGMDSEEDTENYVTEKGLVLPGSAFGQAARRDDINSKQWRMLVCNGPRPNIGPHASGAGDHIISFVNECITMHAHQETFDARLSVIRVDEQQLLLTDGTRTLMARFTDELAFVNGVFRQGSKLSKMFQVGDVLDIQAMGYAHDKHKLVQASFEHYPTCIVTRCVQHLGRDMPGAHVRSLMHRAFLDKEETEAMMPAVDALPLHAVTRSKRTKRRMTITALGAFTNSAALSRRAKHAADMALGMETLLTKVLEKEDFMLLLTSMLTPRKISMLLRVSKIMMCRVLRQIVAAKLCNSNFMPGYLVVPRWNLHYGNERIRRDNIYYQLYKKLVTRQLEVSLGAATGGVALYESNSTARFFSIERVLGSFMQDNMKECRCVLDSTEQVAKHSRPWRSAEAKCRKLRCTRCAVERERKRWLWSLGLGGGEEDIPAKLLEMRDFGTEKRIVMGLRHRFMFRHEPTRWRMVDNTRRVQLLFTAMSLHDSDFFTTYSLTYLQDKEGSRKHRLSDVKKMRLEDGTMQPLDLPGCVSTLKKLHKVFPLTPGSLKMLQEECAKKCDEIWKVWLTTRMCELDERRMMHVDNFMPDLVFGLPRLRVVLQITATLLHGVRVLYVQREGHTRQCVLHCDSDFISFVAHDGRNELMFSTDCESFLRLLDQALVSQEVDAEYEMSTGLNRCVDDLRMWMGGSDANVLADYVVACSVHEVQDVSHVCFSDILEMGQSYSSVIHELRVFDFEILDTKLPYTSLEEEVNPELRKNRLCCQKLIDDMTEEKNHYSTDEDILRVQQERRNGDMESADEASDSDNNEDLSPGYDEEDQMEEASEVDGLGEMPPAYTHDAGESASDPDEEGANSAEEEDLPSTQEYVDADQ